MTQSHVLITALAGQRLRAAGRRVHLRALVLGSLMPDVPLIVLTFGYFAWHRLLVPLPAGAHLFGADYDTLYFGNAGWIVATSLFHAPALIALMAWIGARTRRLGLVWFAAGCGFHTLLDVFTHHDDGPLLLFPFNWTYRFAAPISYWHPQYGGRVFARFENLLDLAILAYFGAIAVTWLARWWGDRQRTL